MMMIYLNIAAKLRDHSRTPSSLSDAFNSSIMNKDPKNPSMKVKNINSDVTENQVKSKISNSNSP